MYTFVRWRKLKFTFKALTNAVSPDAFGGPGNHLTRGTMSTVVDYDPTNSNSYAAGHQLFPTKNQMLDSAGSKETSLGKSFTVYVSCNPTATNNSDLMHTLDGDPNESLTQIRKNYGMLAIRYDGPSLSTDTSVPIYDLWVDYEVELYKPRSGQLLNPEQGTLSLVHFDSTVAGTDITDDRLFGVVSANAQGVERACFGPRDIITTDGHGNKVRSPASGPVYTGLPTAAVAHKFNRIAFMGIPGHVYKITLIINGSSLNQTSTIDFQAFGPGFEAFNALSSPHFNHRSVGDATGFVTIMYMKCIGNRVANVIDEQPSAYVMKAGDYWVDLVATTTVGTPTSTDGYTIVEDCGLSKVFADQ